MQNENNQNPQVEMDMPVPSEPETTQAIEAPQAVELPTEPRNRLTQAREEKRLSVGDAAYALKVGNKVIQSIEASNWQALPGRTFTVGILRAYGRLLDVSVDDLIAEIPGASPVIKKAQSQVASTSKASPVARRDGETKRQEKRMLKFGVVMVLLAIVLAYAMPSSVWDDMLESVESLVNRWVRQDVTQPAATTETTSVSTESPKTESAAETVVQSQTGPGTLELKFSAPAWVEVRDYTGRIIYSQLNAAGSTQFITGAAPLDVMIGNAKQVQARWRDESVKLDKLSGDDVSRQILR